MKKVLVIGSGGSGKSTFSRALGEVTGLPVIHLDSIYWRPNWQKTPSEEWERTVARLVRREAWIMDGNFGGTRAMRVQESDTVILLDISRWICVYRVLKRTLKYRGRTRPDMGSGCGEKLDLEFLLWIWTFPRQGRQRILEEMKAFPKTRFVILRSERDVRDFLELAKEGR